MAQKLVVCAQGSLGRRVDERLEWVMRQLSGYPDEEPQRTHRWNNHHLREEDVAHLNIDWMVNHPGDDGASKPFPVPILAGAQAHITWKRYLVLEPNSTNTWYVGWRWPGDAGVSRIPSIGLKRVLIGPGPTEWFGIDANTQEQIPIKQIGEGKVGDGGEFAHIPVF